MDNFEFSNTLIPLVTAFCNIFLLTLPVTLLNEILFIPPDILLFAITKASDFVAFIPHKFTLDKLPSSETVPTLFFIVPSLFTKRTISPQSLITLSCTNISD